MVGCPQDQVSHKIEMLSCSPLACRFCGSKLDVQKMSHPYSCIPFW